MVGTFKEPMLHLRNYVRKKLVNHSVVVFCICCWDNSSVHLVLIDPSWAL